MITIVVEEGQGKKSKTVLKKYIILIKILVLIIGYFILNVKSI